MSYIFEVYPSTNQIPSFNKVMELSNQYLAEALKKFEIRQTFSINVSVCNHNDRTVVSTGGEQPAIWTEEEYAWFLLSDNSGGCDAYCYTVDEETYELWEENFRITEHMRPYEQQMKNCLETGIYWRFRRSAGQPASLNLAYGMIAAAFAHLTNGLIYTDDGAWDFKMFPTSAEVFLQHYFDPEYPDRSFAKRAKAYLFQLRKASDHIPQRQRYAEMKEWDINNELKYIKENEFYSEHKVDLYFDYFVREPHLKILEFFSRNIAECEQEKIMIYFSVELFCLEKQKAVVPEVHREVIQYIETNAVEKNREYFHEKDYEELLKDQEIIRGYYAQSNLQSFSGRNG